MAEYSRGAEETAETAYICAEIHSTLKGSPAFAGLRVWRDAS
jgi:hypothetical protein